MNIICELTPGEIGMTGLIIAVIGVFTALGFVKGVVKMMFLLITVIVSGYVAYLGSCEGAALLQKSMPAASSPLTVIFAVISGLVTFYIVSKIFSFIIKPFENNQAIAGVAFGLPAGVISLFCVVFLVWLSLNFLNNKGGEGELAYMVSLDNKKEETRMKSYPILASLKQKSENAGLSRTVANLFKIHDTEKFNLAKMLIIARTDEKRMLELGKFSYTMDVYSHSEMGNLLQDLATRKQIEDNDIKALLRNPLLSKSLREKKFREALGKMPVESLIY